MRHHTIETLFILALTFALCGAVVSTASAEEPAGGSEAEESTTSSDESSEDAPGSAIVDPDNTGLQLGGGDVSTDDALARVEGGRESDHEDSKGSPRTSDEGGSEEHVCEPYPSCAKADLGSRSSELDVETFQDVARSNADQLRACFEGALEEGKSGQLTLAFTVDAEGETAEVEIKESSIGGEEAHQCARESVSDWEFPKPSEFGYESLEITHPFIFRADQ